VNLIPTIVLIVVIGLIWLITGSVRRAKQQKKRRIEFLRNLGFYSVPEDEPMLVQKIASLNPKKTGPFSTKNLQVRKEYSYSLYLYDLHDSSGDGTTINHDQVSLVAGEWSLPRFSILPKIESKGFLAQMANQAMTWAAGLAFVRVDFPEDPPFQDHFILAGDDESALRAFFTPARRQQLLEHHSWCLEGYHDILNLSKMDFSRKNKEEWEQQILSTLDTASALARIFTESE